MAEPWFALSRADQAEALEVAAAATGRPPHLLEKDIWEMLQDLLRDSHPIPACLKAGQENHPSDPQSISAQKVAASHARSMTRINAYAPIALPRQ